jgi:hypothetical protein
MRSNHRVNALFHFRRAPAEQTAFYWQRVENVKTSLRMETRGDRTVLMETKTTVVLASHLTRIRRENPAFEYGFFQPNPA